MGMNDATTAAALRKLANAHGLKNVRVRKGTGCRKGFVHVLVTNEASREDRVALVAFLRAVDATVFLGYSPIDLQAVDPRFVDSVSVSRWAVAA